MMRPIIFLDANTIWHRRIAEALAVKVPLVAVNPVSGLVPRKKVSQQEGGLDIIEVSLPPGWASATAIIGQRILHRVVKSVASRFQATPHVVLSSPAYARLAPSLAESFPLLSYTADDYSEYEGWGGDDIKEKERQIHSLARLSVFVSEALRNRAIVEYGLAESRTLVCPNATEPRFSRHDVPLPEELRCRGRPIVGVLGGLSDRLDLDLVANVAASPLVGTFLVAGPVANNILVRHPVLCNSNVVITGHLPHSEMHRYALAMDVGLIPYKKTQLNCFCSPMRLYDHLATGVPIFASEGCDQIDRGSFENLHIAPEDQVAERLEAMIEAGPPLRSTAPEGCFWSSRADLLLEAIGTDLIRQS